MDTNTDCLTKAATNIRSGKATITPEDSVFTGDITYLLGLGELNDDPSALASLSIGAQFPLRRGRSSVREGMAADGRHHEVEVCTTEGRALGYLPPDDARAIAALLDAGAPAAVRITGLIPAFWRMRVQLAIEVGRAAGSV